MVITSGATATTGSSGGARRRLLSAVSVVGAYLAGRRRSVTLPPPPPGTLFDVNGRVNPLERSAGPLGPGPNPAPVPPRPVDKPLAVAHYQAMASQVAYERKMADLDVRLEAIDRDGVVPRGVPLPPAHAHPNGDRRRA